MKDAGDDASRMRWLIEVNCGSARYAFWHAWRKRNGRCGAHVASFRGGSELVYEKWLQSVTCFAGANC
jgi:hypothetical protein